MSFLVQRLHASPTPDDTAISVLDRGFQLGDGVFDTMACFGGKAFLAGRHLARLHRHAAAIGISLADMPVEEMLGSVLTEIGDRHAIIRTTVSRGRAARGLWPDGSSAPSLVITAQPWSPALLGQPARLVIASAPRNQRSPLSRIKSLAYLDNILAAREAAGAAVDDALILNLDGNAVCSTIANVFAVVDGMLVTPSLEEGCLDGVIRGLVLEEAQAMGLASAEQSFTPALLERAEGLFLTNSVRMIRPVTVLDGRPLPAAIITGQMLARLLARIERETAVQLAAPLPI